MRLNPEAMTYDKSQKFYRSTGLMANGTFHCPICMRDSPHEHRMVGRWIGVDFDGTLSVDRFGRDDPYELGEPIPGMVARVKEWIARGYEVRLFTARMCDYSHTVGCIRDVGKMRALLRDWCLRHIGQELECTNVKDGKMEALWDDRAVRVVRDTGQPAEFAPQTDREHGD